jgi:signal transduction histidine kinase
VTTPNGRSDHPVTAGARPRLRPRWMLVRHTVFIKIYLSFLAIVVLSLVAAGLVSHLVHGGPPPHLDPSVHSGPPRQLIGLVFIALAMAAGTWPLARSITRRLEALRRGVDQLGGGDLTARVAVQGDDEVAALAQAFNRSADRIEALVSSQREMLAAGSHELRSPLARLRLAVELMADGSDESERLRHRAEAVRSIEELDALVEEILLVGRLEAGAKLEPAPLDLLALAAEEAARVGAEVGGEPCTVQGDEALLRVALRNLLDNAQRHGAPPVSVEVRSDGARALVRVRDEGPGVPEPERARIFEPFYRPQGHGAEPSEGTGLGLALVARVTARHGGQARCEDGPGSSFTLELPVG